MFVSIGECMVEIAPNGAAAYQLNFAGDTFNAAWTARLVLEEQVPVRYVTAIGVDWMSDMMLESIARAGIEADHVRRVSDRTVGLYAVRVVEGERSFAYWRRDSAATRLASDIAALRAAVRGARTILVSGITVAILPAEGRDILWQVLQEARAEGAEIAFDPNFRPRLWQDVVEARREILRFFRIADTALPTFADEAELFEDPDPAASLGRIRDCGATTIVVKNGSRNAECLFDGVRHSIPAVKVPRLVDTTGAGDAFNGTFLGRRLAGSDDVAAVEAAHRVAAKAVQTPGALLPSLD